MGDIPKCIVSRNRYTKTKDSSYLRHPGQLTAILLLLNNILQLWFFIFYFGMADVRKLIVILVCFLPPDLNPEPPTL